MGDMLGSLDGRYVAATGADAANKAGINVQKNNSLDMSDFLYLMVQQFQNQTMDNTASTADMMNQLVQMSVVQAVTNITDATTLMYSASLVGKEVTVGVASSDGKFEEIVGVVTATGSYGGEQVIFIDDKAYKLNEIMAIGRLPEIKDPEEPGDEPGDKPGDEPGDKPGDEPGAGS